jgi:translation initiation factor IF-2
MILLQADVLELKAVAEGPASGIVIESRLDKGRGPAATVLIQQGQLRKGDILLAGSEYGRVRTMIGDNGKETFIAGPSMPVEVLGLSGTPSAGDEAIVVPNEKKAREVAMFRQGKYRAVKLARQQAAKLENIFERMAENEVLELNIVIKCDVQGSLEAITDALEKLSTKEVKVMIVSSGVGGINGSDVNLAIASNAVVIGFNVRADAIARQIVENEGVDLRYYSIIYDLMDDIKAALSGMLSPEQHEKIVGLAQVRSVFRSSKIGAIAGCMVIEGALKRNLPIRVLRDNVVIYVGHLESLRRFKDDVTEVKKGIECGVGVKDYNDVKEGDQIEAFETFSVARKL